MNRLVCLAVLLAGCAQQPTPPVEVAVAPAHPDGRCHNAALHEPVLRCPEPGAPVVVWGDSMAMAWTEAVREKHPQVASLTRDSCPPMGTPGELKGYADCRRFAAMAQARASTADTLYLAAKWTPYDLAPVLDAVAPKVRRVVVIGPTPHAGVTRAQFDADAAPVWAMLRQAAEKYPNVELVDVTDRFCTATECPQERDGKALYTDAFHLTRDAVRGAL